MSSITEVLSSITGMVFSLSQLDKVAAVASRVLYIESRHMLAYGGRVRCEYLCGCAGHKLSCV